MNQTQPLFGARLVHLIAVVSFAFILFMPVSQGRVLVMVFAFMGLAAVLTNLVTGRALSLPVMAIAGLTLLLGLIGLAVGVNNPGFLNALGIFVAVPALFFLCISALGQGSVRALIYTGAIMTIVSGVYILVYAGGQLGVIPAILPPALLEITGAGFGLEGNSTAIRFFGLSTLAASGPMWLASIFVKRDAILPPIQLRIAAAAAGVAGALIGGRRAIILALVLIPVIAWFMKRSTRDRSIAHRSSPFKVIAGIGVLGAVVLMLPTLLSNAILINTWQSVLSFFTGGTAGGADADQSVRTEQSDRLLEAWGGSPLWGHGLGATINGYSRSQTRPWQFEMQYETLLMQTGLVGAILVAAIAATVVFSIFRATKMRPDLTPTLIVTLSGGAAMLIANATNPYLQAPAHHWAIFLPLAVINVMIRDPAPQDISSDLAMATAGRSAIWRRSRIQLSAIS